MKIDLFNHFFPKRYFEQFIDTGGIRDIGKRVRNIQAIHDVEFRFKVMDEIRAQSGDYCQVLSLPAPPIEALGDPDKSPEVARIANDGLAELVAKHPGPLHRLRGVRADEQSRRGVKEIDRAVTQLGARRHPDLHQRERGPARCLGACTRSSKRPRGAILRS